MTTPGTGRPGRAAGTAGPAVAPPRVRPFVVEVVRAERLSPAFVRVALRLAGADADGPPLGCAGDDQRVRLLLPPPAAPPDFDWLDEVPREPQWYPTVRRWPGEVTPPQRTYTVRRCRDGGREVDVDVVLHGLDDGSAGPAARWAAATSAGDRVLLVGPEAPVPVGVLGSRPGRRAWGLDTWHPDAEQADRWVLAADETAVPAVSAVLEGLDDDGPQVLALLEVPSTADADLPLAPVPARAEVRWLPREDGDAVGSRLREELPGAVGDAARPQVWLAAESGVVQEVRRDLLTGLGLDRARVDVVGYWRRGRDRS